MTQSQTQKKEKEKSDPQNHYTTTSGRSQQKTLVINTIQENSAFVSVYSHCLIFRKSSVYNHKKESNHAPRGLITHFSKRSRFRLFTLLSQIDDNLPFNPVFVSLTYHYGHLNNPKSTKSQLHIFLTRLRQFDPGVQFIWRIELQSRGAPHYHLIIFPSIPGKNHEDKSYNLKLSKIWHSIADPGSRRHKEYGCNIKTINSYSEACAYLSKYVAKEFSEGAALIKGKHWGCSRSLPVKVKDNIKLDERSSRIFTQAIRRWLIQHGKEKYADPQYVNIASDYTVFIDYNSMLEFWKLIVEIEGENIGNNKPLGY